MSSFVLEIFSLLRWFKMTRNSFSRRLKCLFLEALEGGGRSYFCQCASPCSFDKNNSDTRFVTPIWCSKLSQTWSRKSVRSPSWNIWGIYTAWIMWRKSRKKKVLLEARTRKWGGILPLMPFHPKQRDQRHAEIKLQLMHISRSITWKRRIPLIPDFMPIHLCETFMYISDVLV